MDGNENKSFGGLGVPEDVRVGRLYQSQAPVYFAELPTLEVQVVESRGAPGVEFFLPSSCPILFLHLLTTGEIGSR